MGIIILALLNLLIKVIICENIELTSLGLNNINKWETIQINKNNNNKIKFIINEKHIAEIKDLKSSYMAYVVDDYDILSSIIVNNDKINLDSLLKFQSASITIFNSIVYFTDRKYIFKKFETVNCTYMTNNLIFPSDKEIIKYYIRKDNK
jgi:hypothetical protein